jgi:hypothetical protein
MYIDVDRELKEWLGKWDAGQPVQSIEMGGLGPGYEQAIQVTTVELLRHMLKEDYNGAYWIEPEFWEKDRGSIISFAINDPIIKDLGLSGAQFGAALNLATMLYLNGVSYVMKDERVKDRHIRVSKEFPSIV